MAVDAKGDGGGFLLFFAEHEHGVDFVHLGVADFAADFVAGKIRAATDAGALELVEDLPGVFVLMFGDGQHAHLFGREPQREVAGEVLDENAHESLEAAEGRAMNHHGLMRGVVRADVFEAEALGQIVIELHGAELPFAAEAILHHKVELRPVERCFARHGFVWNIHVRRHASQRGLGGVPVGGVAGVLVAARFAQAHLHAEII